MKKTLLMLLFLLWVIQNISAQSQKNERNQEFVRFETPTVASFTKFIDHPVSLYNGTPDMSVPIYTLKDGAIEIPVTLRYNSSGIKVSEESGWVGLGWNLNVGGMIVQNMVGKEDRYKPDFTEDLEYYSHLMPVSTYNTVPYKVDDKNKYNSFFFLATEGRLQPDAFYFSYPGYSGKFFIDYRTDSVFQLKKEKPVRIEYSKTEKAWTITTEAGIVHNFKDICSSVMNGYVEPVSVTYYLTNSKYPNGQEIKYTYAKTKVYTHSIRESQVFPMENPAGISLGNSTGTYNTYTDEVKGEELTLSAIETGNYKIEFITSSRKDLAHGFKLDEVKISALKSEWGFTPKRFKFTYDYFLTQNAGNYYQTSNGVNGGVFDMEIARRRLKLLSVHEVVGTSVEHNKYSFGYYDSDLPVKTSYASDYWGYYNGEISNTCLTPDFKMLLRTDLGDKLSKWQHYKANRAYHFGSCLAGMLKNITYPTGGYFVYTYEPNQFQYVRFIPTKEEIKEEINSKKNITDRNNTTDSRTCSFELTNTARCKFTYKLDRGLNSWFDVQDSKYTLTRSGIIYKTEKISSPVSTNDAFVEKEFSLELPAGSYTLSVDIPDKLGDQYGWNLKHAALTMSVVKELNRNYSIGAGLRVAKIDFYESPATTSSKYSVEYKYPNGENNGILHSPIQFHRNYNTRYTVKQVFNQAGTYYEYKSFSTNETEISSSSYSSSPYSASGGVGYSTVREIITGKSDSAGYKIYGFYNMAEISSDISVQIPNPANGSLSGVKYYNNTGKEIKAERFEYTSTMKHQYCGVNIIDNFNRTPVFYNSGSSQFVVESPSEQPLADFGDYTGRYTTLLYPLIGYELLLNSKTTSIEGIETKETYKYNGHGLQKESATTQSNGKSNLTQRTYPSDYNCGVYKTMQDKNMLAFPVEERNIIDSKLVSGKLTQYMLDGENIVPASISLAVNTTAGNPAGFSCTNNAAGVYPQKNIQFAEYDGHSNPLSISRNDTDKVVYLWSYNYQYPIAEIKNATFAEAETAVKTVFSVASIDALSALSVPNETRLKDGSLQKVLPNALVTTYTYKPLVGILTMTDPSGITTYYDYDAFGRLKRTCIKEGTTEKNIQTYDYHYQNQ